MNLYIVRHGLTDWNVQSKIQGRSDIPLNDTGKIQAYEVAQKLKDKNINKIISSPLIRTVQTAKIIAKELDILEIEIDDRILERDFGKFEGMFSKDPNIDFKSIVSYSKNLYYEKTENIRVFYNRVHNYLDNIISKYKNTDINILLVSHASVSIAVSCYFLGLVDDEKLNNYKLGTCEFKQFKV